MYVPVHRMKKSELLWFQTHRCRHNHTYLEHWNCWLRESKEEKKIGFLDIESGGSLNGDYGYVFSYCIKKLNGKIIANAVTQKEIRNYTFDKRLMKDFCTDVKKFDTLVVYYGKDTGGRFQRHDIPFLRTRVLRWDLDKRFPGFKELKIIDMYDVVKSKLKLRNNKLSTVCRFLKIPAKSSPIVEDTWLRALAGDTKALNYVLKHDKEDVVSTENIYKRLFCFKPTISTT